MSRTRSIVTSGGGGGIRQRTFNGAYLINDTKAPISSFTSDTCVDDVGFGVDHALTITHIAKNNIQPLTGYSNEGAYTYRYTGWYPDAASAAPTALADSLPSNSVIATATVGRSNPSRPSVSVPNFLFELKDLPGMIREIGHLKLLRTHSPKELARLVRSRGSDPKFGANLYLSAQMGWKPLISDLRKIIQHRESVVNRMRDLDILFNQNGGLHRRVGKSKPNGPNGTGGHSGSWTEVTSTSGTKIIDSALGKLVTVRWDKVTTTEMWGSVRWTNPFPKHSRLSSQDLERRARQLVFGISITPKQIWDAVPWSWLIDWFANYGDYLDSTNNLLSLSHSTPLVMKHKKTVESWSRIDSLSWLDGGNGSLLLETKSRVSSALALSATLPIFSGGQFATLGALAIQRLR